MQRESNTRANQWTLRAQILPIFVWFTLFLVVAHRCAFADFEQAPATWEEITQDFAALLPNNFERSQRDGALLKQIDPARALAFLLPFLEKDQPQGVRLNAINALRGAALPESYATIAKMALDKTEDAKIRYAALSPTLAKIDRNKGVDVAIACLRDESRQVRLGAYWLLGETGGQNSIAALENQFLTTDDKEPALRALGYTHDLQAIKFLVDHCPLDQLRANKEWRDTFVRSLAQTPVVEAQNIMVQLMKEGNWFVRSNALPYFRAFPCAEAGPYIVALFDDPKYGQRSLRTYPDLWFFANSEKLAGKSKERLRAMVRECYPEAVFGKPANANAPPMDDETLAAIIAASFEGKPAGLYPNQRNVCVSIDRKDVPPQMLADLQKTYSAVLSIRDCPDKQSTCYVHAPQRLASDQILLRETFYDSQWGFLMVQKNGKWTVATRELLRIICW